MDRLPVLDVRARLEQLNDLLDRAAAAMAAVDADALLAIEGPLARTLEALRASVADGAPGGAPAVELRGAILRARMALRHCDRLGLSFAAASGMSMHASGAYGRDGAFVRGASRPALDVVT